MSTQTRSHATHYIDVLRRGVNKDAAGRYGFLIRREIARGLTIWKELGITSDELNKLVARSETICLIKLKSRQRKLAGLQEHTRQQKTPT